MAEPRRPTSRHGLSPDSPLVGHGRAPEGYDPQTGVLDLPSLAAGEESVDLRELRGLVPAAEPGREVDDAMPIVAHVPLLQKLTGLIYFPINHAFPTLASPPG